MRSEDRNSSGGICEIYDVSANQEEFEMLAKISQANKVKLRDNGVKGYKKPPSTKAQKGDQRSSGCHQRTYRGVQSITRRKPR